MNLFDYEPAPEIKVPESYRLARKTDPPTSHQAAENIVDHVPRLIVWATDCVKKTEGRTRRELGKLYSPDDPDKIGRRLDGCVKAGLLKRGKLRQCTVSNANAQTWWPAESTHPDSYPEERNG